MAATRQTSEFDATTPQMTPSGRRAVNGQDVVDQRVDPVGEQAEIERNSAQQDAAAARERASTPSVRFWDSPSAHAGALFALLAGLLTLATRVWPIAPPQSHGGTGFFWMIPSVVVAISYLGGFFMADRHWLTARLLLLGAATVHVLLGLFAGAAVDAQAEGAGLPAMLFDFAPAVLAVVAALLIAPPAPAAPDAPLTSGSPHAARR
jgi:hypothetical protein